MRSRLGRVAVHLALALALGLAAVACGATQSPAGSGPAGSGSASASFGPSGTGTTALTVFAAASLKPVFTELARRYELAHPGVAVTASFDASSTLRTQIEQGAPADVFVSADTASPQQLVDAGLAHGPITPFAGNRLTILVPAANPAHLASPADLARPGVKVVAAAAGVPITSYAERVVTSLANLPGYPAGYAAAVAANVVSREDNVRGIVTKIELGEGDAGFVYLTDARSAAGVTTVPIPDAANLVATYAAVAVGASGHAAAAADFVAYLAGPDAFQVLAAFGFVAPAS